MLQAGGAFDEISYQKGAAAIRMLEAYAGEDAFRAGVRRYIAAHAYGNTVTDDLWRQIDPRSSKGRPIADIAHDFTLQVGRADDRRDAPTRPATAGPDQTPDELAQGRFTTDAAGSHRSAPGVSPSRSPRPSGASTEAVVSGRAVANRPITIAGCGPTIINAGQAGYFRSRYAPETCSPP